MSANTPTNADVEPSRAATADTAAQKSPALSVVIPVYGCRKALEPLHERLSKALTRMDITYEIVLVDDACPQNSWETLEQIAAKDAAVRALRLSRNFGQHAAITAGLSHASGQCVVVMDCDLQEPPELIPDLYESYQNGCDVVLSTRIRKQQSWLRRGLGRLYFSIMNLLNRTQIDPNEGTLSLIDRKVVDAFLRMQDVHRHYLLAVRWLGFPTGRISYTPEERHEGRSSYSFVGLLRHAIDGVLFQTTTILSAVVVIGFIVALTGAVLAGYYLWLYLTNGALEGWTSLIVVTLLVGGFTIIAVGVVGVYIAKIFEQVKGRPLFVVARDTSVEASERSPAKAESTVRPVAAGRG